MSWIQFPIFLGCLVHLSGPVAFASDGGSDRDINQVEELESVWRLDSQEGATSHSWLIGTVEGSGVLFVGDLSNKAALTVLDSVQQSHLTVRTVFLTSAQVPEPSVFHEVVNGLRGPLVVAEINTIENIAHDWRDVMHVKMPHVSEAESRPQQEKYQYPLINAFVGRETFKIDSLEILAVGSRSKNGSVSVYYLPERGLLVIGKIDQDVSIVGKSAPEDRFIDGMIKLLQSYEVGELHVLSTDWGMLKPAELISRLCLNATNNIESCHQ